MRTYQKGDRVRIISGFIGAGRTGTVTDVRGDVHTVEFTAPKLILDPNGEQESKRLPFASAELAPAVTP